MKKIEKKEEDFAQLGLTDDTSFKNLLNKFLNINLNNKFETADVPGDGSCLYHAVLKSFESKYFYKLEKDHKELRKNVAQYLLTKSNQTRYLERFRQDEIRCVEERKEDDLQERYRKFCITHMYNTTHWPVEVCIVAVTVLYNVEITVLAESLLENGKPGGEIFERLTTTPYDFDESRSIFIGNRWNQHFYGIGSVVFLKNLTFFFKLMIFV